MLKTTSQLLTSISDRTFWPASGGPYDDASLLSMATDLMQGDLFLLLTRYAPDIYAASTDVSLVAGTATYRIPADAGLQLRDVLYIDSAGEEHQLDIMPKDKLGFLQTTGQGTPRCFYMDAHRVGLWPTPAASVGSVRFKWLWQPATLVADGTTVASFISTSVTPAADVAGWTTAAGATWDLLADTGAHGVIGQFTGTYAVSSAITDVSGLHADCRVGDIIAQEGETHVPQVPTEAFSLLCQQTTVRALTGHGDKTVLRDQMAEAARLEDRLIRHLERRVIGESPIFNPTTIPIWGL